MIFSNDLFSGHRILITGGSSGIGRTTGLLLSKAGAELVLCGRDEQRLQDSVAELSGDNHSYIAGDFGSVDAAHDAIVEAAKAGVLSGVFHSAGVASLRIAKLYNQSHLENVFAASVFGAIGISKACAKSKVLADGGSLVFMSSVAGSRGRAGMGAYASAKAAIGGLTRALAAEFSARQVRVNEIVAGAIETPMHESIVKHLDDSGQDAYRKLHLLGFGQPEDIANSVAFLMSPAARWMTGSSLVVDGGYMAG